jgi:hypothetical protein
VVDVAVLAYAEAAGEEAWFRGERRMIGVDGTLSTGGSLPCRDFVIPSSLARRPSTTASFASMSRLSGLKVVMSTVAGFARCDM